MSRLRKALLKALENVPSLTLSPEREEELINRIANAISQFDMETPAILFLAGYIPVSTVLTQTVLIQFVPFLEALGISGYEYAALFNNKGNVKRLLNRLEEIRRGKEK